ncbi:hypothetical protein BC831DRAFT_484180 [Entophlyctis helioformis]|nr:hypothetical protein BC831DRAFT_484180 [Entophlyctis helioformis]
MTMDKRLRLETAAPAVHSQRPELVGVQMQLPTMGMRVRKSVQGGYKITKKPDMTIVQQQDVLKFQANDVAKIFSNVNASLQQEQQQHLQYQSVQPVLPRTDSAAGVKRQRDITDFFSPASKQ